MTICRPGGGAISLTIGDQIALTGEYDGGCNPRLNRQIAAALPNSELAILNGLRHAILLEAPEQVAPSVLSFLERHR